MVQQIYLNGIQKKQKWNIGEIKSEMFYNTRVHVIYQPVQKVGLQK